MLVSGGGTNLQAVIDAIQSGEVKNASIATVISSKKDAFALKRAEKYGIPGVYISKTQFNTIQEYDQALIEQMKKYDVQLILLCGFLAILGQGFINEYQGRIINIHPSLIPAFCGKGYYGMKVHEEVLKYGVKVTGATVHFVELEPDAGPIILQKAVEIKDDDTAEILQRRVMEQAEWILLPKAVKLIEENKLKVVGRRVFIEE